MSKIYIKKDITSFMDQGIYTTSFRKTVIRICMYYNLSMFSPCSPSLKNLLPV